MTDNPNELTIENSALVLIDHPDEYVTAQLAAGLVQAPATLAAEPVR